MSASECAGVPAGRPEWAHGTDACGREPNDDRFGACRRQSGRYRHDRSSFAPSRVAAQSERPPALLVQFLLRARLLSELVAGLAAAARRRRRKAARWPLPGRGATTTSGTAAIWISVAMP